MANPPPAQAVQTALGVHVTGFLGGGAFRKVFSAVAVATGEEVAVASEALGHEQQVDAAVMVRLASQPSHPHIIGPPASPGITPRYIAGGRCYTVLQRCQQDVFDCITDAGGALTEAAARVHFLQMVAGLRFMHQCGVGHRDLKLENMMLTHDGTLKLIDFGLAHLAPLPAPLHAPWAMVCEGHVGTKSYCAPEVAHGAPYDASAADVWSLGCTLFALVTGFFIVDKAHPSDPRFQRMARAQASGNSTVRAIFGLYNRPCILSAPLVALLDGMFTIDPAMRLTIEGVVSNAWVGAHYAPFLAREESYRNDVLNRRRASARWARLTGATFGFGRALSTLRGMLEGQQQDQHAAGTGEDTAGADLTDADMFDAFPVDVSRAPSWTESIAHTVTAPVSGLFRSLSSMSGMSDDEMGPPVWRSVARLSASDSPPGSPAAYRGGAPPIARQVSPALRSLGGLDDVSISDSLNGLAAAVPGLVQPPKLARQPRGQF